jgi:hypothetical protein
LFEQEATKEGVSVGYRSFIILVLSDVYSVYEYERHGESPRAIVRLARTTNARLMERQ